MRNSLHEVLMHSFTKWPLQEFHWKCGIGIGIHEAARVARATGEKESRNEQRGRGGHLIENVRARDRLLEAARDAEVALGRVVCRLRRRAHHFGAERTQHVHLQHNTWSLSSQVDRMHSHSFITYYESIR